MKAKVVIGANYGDEGKGLTTDWLAHQSVSDGDKCIVVLCNGGSQRGHTVSTPEGLRHVFHHFGSGTFAGADTYLSQHFILNPIIFRTEWKELEKLGYMPVVYVNSRCTWSTPYDMMLNQILEESRGDERHGSCGYGIWETVCRYEMYPDNPTIRDISKGSNGFLRGFLRWVRDTYILPRLSSQGVSGVPNEWVSIVNSDTLVQNFIDDMRFMLERIILVDTDDFLMGYDTAIFEMGQGLMLEDTYAEAVENATPSWTGLHNPVEIIRELPIVSSLQAYFVTRTYITRHGAGALEDECSKNSLNSVIDDKTNIPNAFQGRLRYAPLDTIALSLMVDRALNEFQERVMQEPFLRRAEKLVSLVITHLNEVDFCTDFDMLVESDPIQGFSSLFLSDGDTRDSVFSFEVE